jgi:hypothetical protein
VCLLSRRNIFFFFSFFPGRLKIKKKKKTFQHIHTRASKVHKSRRDGSAHPRFPTPTTHDTATQSRVNSRLYYDDYLPLFLFSSPSVCAFGRALKNKRRRNQKQKSYGVTV